MKQPITIDEHKQLGQDLASIDTTLTGIMRHLSHRRGIKCATLDRLLKVDDLIGRVRMDLEMVLFADHTRATGASTDVYFPGPEPR